MTEPVRFACNLCGRDHTPKMSMIATSEGYLMQFTSSICRPAIQAAAEKFVGEFARQLGSLNVRDEKDSGQ